MNTVIDHERASRRTPVKAQAGLGAMMHGKWVAAATDSIAADTAGTLSGLFRCRVAQTPTATAYRQHEQGAWRDYRWKDVARRVLRWQRGLAAEGLRPGERVALSLPNGVDWVCFDQAALGLGLVTVPLYTTDSPGNLLHILTDSGARLLLLDTDAQWAALLSQGAELPALRRVLCRRITQGPAQSASASLNASLSPSRSLNPSQNQDLSPSTRTSTSTSKTQRPSQDDAGSEHRIARDQRLRSLVDWLPDSAEIPEDQGLAQPEISPDALATLVYTSGTTGPPKGVMLTHRNILSNAEAIQARVTAWTSDCFLSFLPLAHAFERTVGYYLPMMAGACVAYTRSIDQLREDLTQVHPSVLLAVPRLFDKIYLAIQDKLGERGPKRLLFDKTVALGWHRFEAAQGRRSPPGIVDRLLWRLLRRLVAQPVLERFGGRMRVAVSGGAPLSANVARLFVGLDLPLTEGYGLTEAAPVVSNSTPETFIPGWVGKPLPGVELRLGPQQELYVRGPNRCLGYWQQPEATAQTIDADGWLHTGDVAEIRDGYVGIRGRLKDILVTSTGQKVPPADMENALTMDPLLDQAMVVGEGRPYLAAVLVLSREPWLRLSSELGLDADAASSLTDPRIVAAVQARVEARLTGFPGYARVRALHLTLDTWTIEDGSLTPTMKLKRSVLQKRFAAAIDALYQQPHSVAR
ncbi:AMP-binding protein [Lamprobacter modestohalophilus]|uniref:AMP-binding protein n=1 Tax=Lamprobacter modestohalophilus TaxID=1064514 RepID=UPI0019052975